MRALRFDRFGGLDELHVRDVPTPDARTGEVLVRVDAAAVNPSDVKNVGGTFHDTTLPRTPGRDYAGVIVEGPSARWVAP